MQNPDSEDRTDKKPQALEYLLGNLPPNEEEAFEQDLTEGSEDAMELREYMDTMTSLAEDVARSMPAPRRSLKNQILAAVKESQAHAAEHPMMEIPYMDPAKLLTRANEGEWLESGAPGITLKLLFHDVKNARYTVLAKLIPGAIYPTHRHVGEEQCFVIQGDLQFGELSLNTGDYIVTPDATVHDHSYSVGGALLLLTTALSDEMVTHKSQ
jgi:anti-sigma factor ChrR (cupin superfamily)